MALHTRILLGLVLGALCGAVANALAPDAAWLGWLNHYVTGPAGQIFLRLLIMVVIPLVFATLVLGVTGLGNIRQLGRVGGLTFAYFLVTTALAVILGLVLANWLAPGAGIPDELRSELVATYQPDMQQRTGAAAAGGLGIQTLIDIVPRNPLKAAVDMQMLPFIFFSLFFGIALALLPRERAAPMIQVLETLAEAIVKMIEIVMRLAPYGVFALIFVVTSRLGWQLLSQLGLFVGVVIAGLLIHCAVTLSLAVRAVAGLSPLKFWSRVRTAALTAFSTSSSNATLPTTLLVAERNLGVPREIAGFVLPLGATMNMNGTALFEGVAILFVAQIFGIELSLGQQLIVVLLSVVTAVGAAGVPGGSIPLLMGMATSVGLPGEGIAIILGVDRLLDMCRTAVNVTGDLTATCVVARLEGAWSPRDASRLTGGILEPVRGAPGAPSSQDPTP